jgi:hypothetical protein
MNEKYCLEEAVRGRSIVIGHHSVTPSGPPAALWSREVKARSKNDRPAAELLFSSGGQEGGVIDRGEIGQTALAVSAEGTVFAAWEKMSATGRTLLTVAPQSRGESGLPVLAVEREHASGLNLSVSGENSFLAVWAAVRGKNQVIEAARWGKSEEPFIVSNRKGWAARPSLCALEGSGFFIVWEQYGAEGCTVEATLLDRNGGLRQTTIFPAISPHVRYLNPSCCFSNGKILVTAVEVRDVISDEGAVDQTNTIISALIDPSSAETRPAGSPALLNHGLLAETAAGTGVWGYLGDRRRPVLLPDASLLWERKLQHDGFTPTSEGLGILCRSELDFSTASWGPERVVHRGSYAYEAGTDGNRIWYAHRPVIIGETQTLILEIQDLPVASEDPPELLQPVKNYTFYSSSPKGMAGKSVSAGESDLRLFWGDTHVHSKYSKDAEGEIDELIYYGKHVAQLDFLALTDNDEHYNSWLRNWERQHACRIGRRWTEDGRFIVLDGFEYTQPKTKCGIVRNHRTVILREPTGDFFRWQDLFEQGMDSHALGSRAAAAADEIGALLIAHHPDWELFDAGCELGIEAVSGWDTYMHDPEPIIAAWNSGKTLCLVGGSDNHRRNPGLGGALTGVWAPRLTYRDLIEGFEKRRTVVSQGRRPFVHFTLTDESGNTLFIGDQGLLEGTITANIHVEVEAGADDGIELVELRHRQKVVANWDAADTVNGRRKLKVSYPLRGVDARKEASVLNLREPKYLFLRIRLSGGDPLLPSTVANARGPWVWTTPIWWA